MKETKQKIILLRELKANPYADQNRINKLRKELEWINLNDLTEEEKEVLLTH